MSVHIVEGDARLVLAQLPAATFDMCVTSPPYFGLRDYGVAGQIGLEPSPDDYVAEMVELFRAVRRVLRDDGTLWLNLGDSYAGSWGSQGRQGASGMMATRSVSSIRERSKIQAARIEAGAYPAKSSRTGAIPDSSMLKEKDLMGIPWRVAFALQADGWYLRADIIWHKPNPMPESVTDRPTKAHEYVFLLSKAPRYYYDEDAIAEIATGLTPGNTRPRVVPAQREGENANIGGSIHRIGPRTMRNARSVWSITTQPFAGAHFATMPPELARRCIMAGSRRGAAVLDPFGGAGTTGLVADRLGRDATLIELNPAYAAIARDRIQSDAPLFAEIR